MLTVSKAQLEDILRDYGVAESISQIKELQRDDYAEYAPDTQEVRLILRITTAAGRTLVVRLKNETDVTLDIMESQSRFADHLGRRGIPTPRVFSSNGTFARWYELNGYRVIITVEEYVMGELTQVDAPTARDTGALLARMHQIAQKDNLHVDNPVLFDPFARNDLTDYPTFLALGDKLVGENKALHQQIVHQYEKTMALLQPLREQSRYAVQGDISECNLYRTPGRGLGVFDYNRSGDNILFCDAVMQAFFEARLMDYPREGMEEEIFSAFLAGYQSVRPFAKEEQSWFPHLCAVIDAFWNGNIRWNENCLRAAVERNDAPAIHSNLTGIWQKLTEPLVN